MECFRFELSPRWHADKSHGKDCASPASSFLEWPGAVCESCAAWQEAWQMHRPGWGRLTRQLQWNVVLEAENKLRTDQGSTTTQRTAAARETGLGSEAGPLMTRQQRRRPGLEESILDKERAGWRLHSRRTGWRNRHPSGALRWRTTWKSLGALTPLASAPGGSVQRPLASCSLQAGQFRRPRGPRKSPASLSLAHSPSPPPSLLVSPATRGLDAMRLSRICARDRAGLDPQSCPRPARPCRLQPVGTPIRSSKPAVNFLNLPFRRPSDSAHSLTSNLLSRVRRRPAPSAAWATQRQDPVPTGALPCCEGTLAKRTSQVQVRLQRVGSTSREDHLVIMIASLLWTDSGLRRRCVQTIGPTIWMAEIMIHRFTQKMTRADWPSIEQNTCRAGSTKRPQTGRSKQRAAPHKTRSEVRHERQRAGSRRKKKVMNLSKGPAVQEWVRVGRRVLETTQLASFEVGGTCSRCAYNFTKRLWRRRKTRCPVIPEHDSETTDARTPSPAAQEHSASKVAKPHFVSGGKEGLRIRIVRLLRTSNLFRVKWEGWMLQLLLPMARRLCSEWTREEGERGARVSEKKTSLQKKNGRMKDSFVNEEDALL